MNKAPARKLKRLLESRLNTITKYDAAKSDGVFSQNRGFLLLQGRAARNDLRALPALRAGQKGLPAVYSTVYTLTENGKLPSLEQLAAALRAIGCRGVETDYCALFLKTALVCRAAENIENNEETHKNAVEALRKLPEYPFERLYPEVCGAEQELLRDEGYRVSDETSRGVYRHLLAQAAVLRGETEQETAQTLVNTAEAENSSLFRALLETCRKKPRRAVLRVLCFVPLLLSLAVGVICRSAFVGLFLWLPLQAALSGLLIKFLLHGERPVPVLRCDREEVKQANVKTLIAVSALLPKPDALDRWQAHLEDIYLCAGSENVRVCLLADYKAAKSAQTPADEVEANCAAERIDALNRKYKDAFCLLLRERSYSKTQREYIGRDRKRGAIVDLLAALRGDFSAFPFRRGKTDDFESFSYLLTLDSDTELTLESLNTLLAAALHPENKAVIDPVRRVVTRGYGAFVPRAEVSLESAFKTRFSRAISGTGGVSCYDVPVGEFWQDFTGAGLFTGKGLFHIDTAKQVLPGAFLSETVLSHDIPEGELLRTAFVSDAQITDGVPSTARAYFARLERWVRGDAQNVIFFKKRLPTLSGSRENPLSSLSKWKLLKTLANALVPVCTLSLLLVGAFLPFPKSLFAVFGAALTLTARDLWAFCRALFGGGFLRVSERRFGKAVPAAEKGLCDAALHLALLPLCAWTSFSALCRGIFRRFLTKRHMLDWVTAADSERFGAQGISFARDLFPLLCAVLLFFAPFTPARFFALFFLFAPVYCRLSEKPYKTNVAAPAAKDAEILTADAAAMWQYYTRFCNERNHFLPPDNVQETPVLRVAHRTSPTNIGMMLCSCLAARDLSLISSETLCEMLERTLNSVEKLPRWHGNLLNWYDTETLEALSPRFVSSVDSGNFLCCLTALSEGLSEYAPQCPKLWDVRAQIDALRASCDLSALYDWRRNLFYIGYDLEKNVFSDAHYDLLMSESRMMSYYAVASRQVPKKHWGALSRVMSRSGGYTGALAWSGTMFEFFMPYLFLESRENTLSFEALKYCVHCQRQFAAEKHIPFGISESGYYRFDEQQNYQYKAHGVPLLALRQTKGDELVVSPYSSFLCLPIAPKAALKNLKKLREMGAVGSFGFYEAVDFVHGKNAGQGFSLVRSYMAHHVGMSLLSVDNALSGGVMQKRFLRDRQMCAGRSLLEEKVPAAPVCLQKHAPTDTGKREELPRPVRTQSRAPSPLSPRVAVYGDGVWTSVLTDGGAGYSLFCGLPVTRISRDLLNAPQGVFGVFQAGENTLPLQAVLDRRPGAHYKTVFSETAAVYAAQNDALRAKTVVTVRGKGPVELRRITVQNRTNAPLRGHLLLYFEPSMQSPLAEQAHLAFRKLLVTASRTKENDVLFTRRPRQGETALYCGCGILEDIPYACALTRDKVLTRTKGVFSLSDADFTENDRSGIADVCFAARIPMDLSAHGEKSATLFLCCGRSQAEIASVIGSLRTEGAPPAKKAARAAFCDDTPKSAAANAFLPALFFKAEPAPVQINAMRENRQGVEALWRLGISGDRPILTVTLTALSDFTAAKPFIEAFGELRARGVACDLVLCFSGSETQGESLKKQIETVLFKTSCPSLCSDAGNVYVLRRESISLPDQTTLLALSDALVPLGSPDEGAAEKKAFSQSFVSDCVSASAPNRFSEQGSEISRKPVLPWCYMLANPTFGTLLSDSTLGTTFAQNARLNKLTTFSNDPMLDNLGERLFLRVNGKIFDVLRASCTRFGDNRAEYVSSAAGIQVTVTVTVPRKGMRKQVEVLLENQNDAEKQAEVCYYTRPVLGEDDRRAKNLQSRFFGGALEVHSPLTPAYPGTMRLFAEGENTFFTVHDDDFAAGRWDSGGDLPQVFGCAAVGKKLYLPPRRKERVKFILSFSRFAEGAECLAKTDLPPMHFGDRIRVKTNDKAFNTLFNAFLPNQIEAGRLFARTGFYQSGGAFGFRDQLQDAAALLPVRPKLCRLQIYRCCAAQFSEGDVLHWWHPAAKAGAGKRGVRTRYSDDLFWLPLTVARYVLSTGDREMLEKQIAFLDAPPLEETEDERYFAAHAGKEKASVLEHAKRALEKGLQFGEHGLLKMGAGDWNDSFNQVGVKGKGESVWLSQFAAVVLDAFSALLEALGEGADVYRTLAKNLREAVDRSAWDGDHYLRAYFDDRRKMGANLCEECRIDSLTQSFAVFAKMPDKMRVQTALQTAYTALVDSENGLVRLFWPPFSGKDRSAGYVASYPPGVRENGGQYTHAAVWFCRALFESGNQKEGEAVLSLLNPLKKDEAVYKTEPYYFAGDVYAAGEPGRGGWSLYSGSAGQFYALVTEVFLGLRFINGNLYFHPNPPKSWGAFQFFIYLGGAKIEVTVAENAAGRIEIDGEAAAFLRPDGENHIVKIF